MARISGVGYGGTSGSSYNVYLEYNLISQSQVDNHSIIELRFYAQASSYGITAWNGSPQPYTIKANGVEKTGSTVIDFRNRKVVNFGTERFTVPHNNDGTKTITIGGSFTISSVSSIRGGEVSGTWNLPAISRGSTPTVSADSIEIGGPAITVYTNTEDPTFRHDMIFMLGNRRHQFADKVQMSETFQITAEEVWAREMPVETGKNATIRMITYNSQGRRIGSKDITLLTTVPNTSEYRPEISVLRTSIHGDGPDAELGEFIQGVSRIDVSYEARPGLGSHFKSKKMIIAGTEYPGESATSGIAYISGLRRTKAQVVDGRNREAEVISMIEVRPYEKPKIETFEVTRQTNTSRVKVNLQGTWAKINGRNVLNILIQRKESDGSSWTTIKETELTDTTEVFDIQEEFTVSELISYDFRAIVIDILDNSASALVSVGTAKVPLSLGKKGIGVGKITEERAVLEVGGPTELDGDVDIIGNLDINGRVDLPANSWYNGSDLSELLKLEIEEAGNNSNGDFIKFTNGIMICSHKRSDTSLTINSSTGSMYKSGTERWYYPKSFVAPAATFFAGQAGTVEFFIQPASGATSLVNYKYVMSTSGSLSAVSVSLLAIGRWK